MPPLAHYLLLLLPSILLAAPSCDQPCPVCPTTDHCPTTTLDTCRCCQLCVREINQTCGADLGVCQPGAFCLHSNNHTAGVCEEMFPDECLSAKCTVVFQPKCPPDSVLILKQSKTRQCCQQPGQCQCDLAKCPVPKCSAGSRLVRVAKGSKEPGKCCPSYECKERVLNCEHVPCPPLLDQPECPSDSFRPPRVVAEGDCCALDQECLCRAGICQPAICPSGHRVEIIERGSGIAGRCCDQFDCIPLAQSDQAMPSVVQSQTCLHEGLLYQTGQRWYPDACTQCGCDNGLAFCKKMHCNKPSDSCGWVAVPEGECCPECLGCQEESGRKIAANESWVKDECTSCTCDKFGQLSCDTQMCKVDCERPVKVEGQCCPHCQEPTVLTVPTVCPSIELCSLRCEYGLARDNQGCFICSCAHTPDGQQLAAFPSKCPSLDAQRCSKKCAHGYEHDNDGCVRCVCAQCPPLHQCFKRCLYGFRSNMYGCPVCKCEVGRTKEGDSDLWPDSSLTKVSAVEHQVQCFDRLAGTERDSGEWWFDGCRHCFCEGGREYCSLISCPLLDCSPSEQVIRTGDCCGRCASQESPPLLDSRVHLVCQAPGSARVYVDGETWALNACVRCTCRVGHVLCHASSCPPIACEHSDSSDLCCPSCTKWPSPPLWAQSNSTICTDESGAAHLEGSAWRVDACTSCVCVESGPECFRQSCPPGPCYSGRWLQLKDKCCPICADSLSSSSLCKYGSELFSEGESWRDGPCKNCTCNTGGTTKCKEIQCPPCKAPLPKTTDTCCAVCTDDRWSDVHVSSRGVNVSLLVAGVGVALVIVLLLLLICWLYKRRLRMHSKDTHSHNNNINNCQPILPTVTKGVKKSNVGAELAESLLSSSSESGQSATEGREERPSMYIDLKRLRAFRKRQRLAKPLSCHI